MGPLFILIFVVLGIIIGSLIPALVAKLLMRAVFGKQVFFGMVLLATVLGTLFMILIFVGLMWYSQGTLNLQNLESFEGQMTPAETALSWLFGFMLQLLLLTFVVPDENMELIAAWKWAIVLVLQYVVIFLAVFVIAFLLASSAAFADTTQILTKVV